jgi:acetyl esterase/lipase
LFELARFHESANNLFQDLEGVTMRIGRHLLKLVAVCAVVLCAFIASGQQRPANNFDPAIPHLVLQIPQMQQADVRSDIVYNTVDGTALKLDVYSPPGLKPDVRLPAVIFISGASQAKHWNIYKDYGRLVTTYNMIGVEYDKRYERGGGYLNGTQDTRDLITYLQQHAPELHLDPERIVVWGFSAGGAILGGLLADDAPSLRAWLASYAVADVLQFVEAAERDKAKQYSAAYSAEARTKALPPIWIARAGLDRASLNEGIDRLMQVLVKKNARFDFVNYPDGQHGFDAFDDKERSREVIRAAFQFILANTR